MKNKLNKALPLFIAGAVIGIIVFVFIYGIDVLNVSYDGWLEQGGDLNQHYYGWKFYRKSPLTFPIGLVEGLAPEKVSIIYTDSIPLFALIFKLLSPLLPETFQYFGIWGIMCYMLQGGLAALIIRKFTDNPVICWISSVFFVVSPVVIQRMYGHTSLAGNWIILLAFLLWIYKDKLNNVKTIIAWCVLAALAVMVHMYYIPITFLILLACVINKGIESKKTIKISAITFLSAALCGVLTLFILGGFYGHGSIGEGGLGIYSSNLTTFFNPVTDDFSKYLSPFLTMSSDQGEGFAYLGFGMLLMGFLALVFVIQHIVDAGISKSFEWIKSRKAAVISFTFLLIGAFAYSLSPIITCGNKVILHINFPKLIWNAMSVFRATGRFSWISMYLLYILFIFVIIRKNKKKAAIIILGLCMCVQLSDFSNIFKFKNSYFTTHMESKQNLKDEAWEELANGKEHIVFLPLPENYLVYADMYYSFANYASNHDMTMSSFYIARASYDFLYYYADEQLKLVEDGTPEKNTIYVFMDPTYTVPDNDALEIYELDGYTVGIAAE